MSESILKAESLQKHFPSPHGQIDVLKDITFELLKGESLSIRGESGAGKSTLLSILSGLEAATKGSLFWQGDSVLERSATWQARRRAAFMGMVFQAYYLVPELNAFENVCMASRIANRRLTAEQRSRAESLLVRVGLKDRLKHLANQLSGGERQRVAVARALLNAPALILADEPTGNLDERTGEAVMDMFLRLCAEEQASLILVTHNPEFAARVDRQLFLTGGRLEEKHL